MLAFLLIWVSVFCSFSQGQEYAFPGQHNGEWEEPNQYIHPSNVVPFRQQPAGFHPFLPSDLQTSDLPDHLQQTLPQYRFTTIPPQFQHHDPYLSFDEAPISSPSGFKNYPRPTTLRPNYSHLFSKTHSRNPSQTETFLGQITLQNPIETPPKFESGFKQENNANLIGNRPDFLKHRTRVVVPEATKDTTRPEVSDYFVNTNGEVLTTKATTVGPQKLTSKAKSVALEPLLEEPLKDDFGTNNDDEVEVIKPKRHEDLTTEDTNSTSEENLTTEYDDEEYYVDDSNDIQDGNHKNDSNYEIITAKPTVMVKDTNFKDFVNNEDIDDTETPAKEPEVVVSVVTSKTFINNTVIGGVTENPVTEANKIENTTDTWVVVASVQTSRSVSGARYLPSSVVEQDVRVKLLNEHDDSIESSSTSSLLSPSTTPMSSNNDETTTETSTKPKTSTESLIDKLDQVQSDLSSGLLTGGLGNNNNIEVIKDMDDIKLTTTTTTTTTTTSRPYPQVNIRKFSPSLRKSTTKRPKVKPTKKFDLDKPQSDQPQDLSDLKPGYRFNASDSRSSKLLEEIFSRVKPKNVDERLGEEKIEEEKLEIEKSNEGFNGSLVLKAATQADISKFLPPGYKPSEENTTTSTTTQSPVLKNTKADDISKFLPPGYKLGSTETPIFRNTNSDDISKFLPSGYKLPKSEGATSKTTETPIFKNTKADDISKFLPPGFKLPKSEEKTTEASLFKNTKADDVSKFLPPGYKIPKYKGSTTTEAPLFKNTKADDVSKFLPPGYKPPKTTEKTPEKDTLEGLNPKPVDISSFLPPGYKPPMVESTNSTEATTSTTTTPKSSFKVVFPSRPGSGSRKSTRTTPKTVPEDSPRNTPPTIHKGWPSRATTEFSGWPTPSTTPISIEKLLEAARAASTSTTEAAEEVTTTSTTTTTTTTTTTPKPTTPGVCSDECDLYGTIKLVGGVKWVPELLDRNTKEWQLLANEVESQLDYVYSTSTLLKNWYKKIRIDGFSEGSVLVDYLVELNDVGRRVDTQEIKRLFHESLDDALLTFGGSNREGKSLNESMKLEGKLTLGNFVVDPIYTDFLVLPKQHYPTVGMANDDVLLPQWAIAVIVIGLASLLFVIIFGVTVLVNRQKNAKKKSPTPLTEDMLNELNKNHMGGFDNFGADDLYNMEDVWNDRGYEQKHKKRSNGSLNDNSMSNLYDSWRSEWNGYYYNAYYGNNPGSSHSGYNGRRRSDYDTNF